MHDSLLCAAMASSIPYPPWSAPATLEREREKKSKWQALKKPWFKRPGKKETKKPEARHSREESMEDRYNMNPFAPRQSPFVRGGGFPQFSGSPFANYSPGNAHKSQPVTPVQEPKGLFDPDALVSKPNRPSLAGVFPMYDTPKIAPAHTRTNSQERRHSVSANPSAGNLVTPDKPPQRRPSLASSDITSERSNRRERRANALRAIPLLPHQHRAGKPSIYSSPYRPPPVMGYPPYPGYPPMVMPNSFSFPPWPQPHEQLKELQEELEEEEEVDGGEDPYDQTMETSKTSKEVKSKTKEAKPKEKKSKKKLSQVNEDDNDDGIKGFDGFMMY